MGVTRCISTAVEAWLTYVHRVEFDPDETGCGIHFENLIHTSLSVSPPACYPHCLFPWME